MNNEQREKIKDALKWLGIDAKVTDCDVCEDGSAWYGLTQILGKGSLC